MFCPGSYFRNHFDSVNNPSYLGIPALIVMHGNQQQLVSPKHRTSATTGNSMLDRSGTHAWSAALTYHIVLMI